jgi:hypothetical protein
VNTKYILTLNHEVMGAADSILFVRDQEFENQEIQKCIIQFYSVSKAETVMSKLKDGSGIKIAFILCIFLGFQ